MSLLNRTAESFLPDRDYLPIAMPTTDIQVLQVLTRQGRIMRRYSDLRSVLAAPSDIAAPHTFRNQAVVDTSGMSHRTAKIGFGLSVVATIVKALGGGGDFNVSLAGAAAVHYAYADVYSDRVDLASLDNWLAHADFQPGLRNVTDLLVAEDVYVITAALKAQALCVTFFDKKENEIAVDLPAIQAAVGANISVTGNAMVTSQVTFRSHTPLTVAAKAAQLKFSDDGFWVNERPTSGREIRSMANDSVVYLSIPQLSLDTVD